MSVFSRTLELRWRGTIGDLREIAGLVHEHIRAGVLAKVKAGGTVDFVSCGVATPPGPTRLIFEDRRNGLPGRRFHATLKRDADTFVLAVESGRWRPIPPEFLDTIRQAVLSVPRTEECSPWQ